MIAIFGSLRNTVLAGFVLAGVLFLIVGLTTTGYSLRFDQAFWTFVARWLHVISAILWLGLLYYFNFVQIPSLPNIPEEQRPAVTKVIAPRALFWFRWAAMATLAFGVALALLNNYLVDAILLGITSGGGRNTLIGIGMWLGAIMWFNVWFVIWPAQKKALGLVEARPEERKAAAARSLLVSRTNTMLSVPMLYCMVGAQNPF
jgi:uncharacterized membrane protein